jgi:hypothetical protein
MTQASGTPAFPFAPGELVLAPFGPHVLDARGERVATIRTERGVGRGLALARGIVALPRLLDAAGHALGQITGAARSRFPVVGTCLRLPGPMRGACGVCVHCVLAAALAEVAHGKAPS